MLKNTLLYSFLLITSCGVFQPRDIFEIPNSKVTVDRFNFRSIFDILEKHDFTWKNYETFFTDTFQYNDVYSCSCGKRSFINQLQNIENRYPNFSIKWGIGEVSNWYEDGTSLYITGLVDTVCYDSTSAIKTKIITTTNMIIIRDGEYKISVWNDFPEGEKKSFFAPVE